MKLIMKTLTIAHHIYLTEEQKALFLNGETIEVIGISIPVWFEKGNTSEPAKEVFCKYVISSEDRNIPITTVEDGYFINLKEKENLEFLEFAEGTIQGENIKTVHYVYIKDINKINQLTS